MSFSALDISLHDIEAAATRIAPVAHHTPVLRSRLIDDMVGADLFFKAEHLQRTGSFKIRGAFNAVASLEPAIRARGVAAFSSGNHAQAVAHSAQVLGVPAVIVMPHDAPASKRAATEGYGAEVVTYERGAADREAIAASLADERGLTLIRPFDDPAVIAGQATVGRELFGDVPDLDLVVVCTGGGGLTSGIALAARETGQHCSIVGVEPRTGDDVRRSLETGRIVHIDVPATIADGQMTTSPGEHTFAVMRELVSDIVLVSDDDIRGAMQVLFATTKQVVEPSGASAFAAVLSGAVDVAGKRVAITLSGGNIDPARFHELGIGLEP